MNRHAFDIVTGLPDKSFLMKIQHAMSALIPSVRFHTFDSAGLNAPE